MDILMPTLLIKHEIIMNIYVHLYLFIFILSETLSKTEFDLVSLYVNDTYIF